MALFMIERRFAAELDASAEKIDEVTGINDDEGVRWMYSLLSADKRKIYCLYEAPPSEAIRRAAVRAGLPADVVVEVTDRILDRAETVQVVPVRLREALRALVLRLEVESEHRGQPRAEHPDQDGGVEPHAGGDLRSRAWAAPGAMTGRPITTVRTTRSRR